MANTLNTSDIVLNGINEIASNFSSISNTPDDIKESNYVNPLENVSVMGYFLGLILLICVNAGPYLYFKFYKNKKITSSSSSEPKHAI